MTTCFSIISLTFPDDGASKFGMAEAGFGFGIMLGMVSGSYIIEEIGYVKTFFAYSAFTFIILVFVHIILPDKLNLSKDEKDDKLLDSGPTEAQILAENEVLKDYNKISL